MGWSEKLVFGYGRTKKESCALVRELIAEDYEIVKDTMVNSVYYGACRNKKTREVFGIVVETGWRSGNAWGDWFGYNFHEEFDGPIHRRCPLSILHRLTPTDNVYALEWREECEKNAETDRLNRSKAKRLRELAPGSCIRFANPQETDHFQKGDTVTLHKAYIPGRSKMRTVWTDGTFSWRPALIAADFEVI